MLIKLENALIEAGYLRGLANEDHTESVVFKLTKLGLFYICLLDDTGANVDKRETFTRERLKEMGDRIAEKYPQYHFGDNMGYGSAAHLEALREYGPCPIHRESYIKKIMERFNAE